MRPPANIKNWVSIKKMFQWLQNAPDEHSHKRRMAIWLTHTGNLHAHTISKILGVSTQAVWLWVKQYNAHGPDGLLRKGRGGRRWAFMTFKQEVEFLKPFILNAMSGNPAKPSEIRAKSESIIGKEVSMSYVYRLLKRHKWSEIIAQSRFPQQSTQIKQDFTNYYHPWKRS